MIKPVLKEKGILSYIRYGLQVIVYTILGLVGAVGQLFTTMLAVTTLSLIIGLLVGSFIFVKVQPELEKCRERAYDVLAQLDTTDFSMRSDTEIYDKDGALVGLINAGHYEYVPINEISMNIQNTYIAQEDRRFKEHSGVDFISIARAGLALVKHNGEITQGGSTITQQVIKNTFLTKEQTFTRKITEILLAPEIEKKFSKADIMEFYCNTNFYGNRCYGVQAASRYYFGKDAKDVTWDEAAVLVGISNSPSMYDPVRHPEDALKKRNEVLESLLETKQITQEEHDSLVAKPLNIVQEYAEGTKENYQSSYAIHCAALELMKNDGFEFKYTFDNADEYNTYKDAYSSKYNDASELIRSGGYKIYTTLDSGIQEQLQSVIDTGLGKFVEQQENGKYALQGSAVVVDNKTNYVVAIVGGRGTDDEFNRGYLSARQPGSTIKPLLDYGPAFDTGEYYPSKVMDDHVWEDGPKNSGGGYRGNVTLREALNRSINTIAWQVLEGVGTRNGLEYLGKMQFRTLSYIDNDAPSISLGGFTNGTRVVDMAKGYSTLANGGVYSDKNCITSIIDESDGEIFKSKEKTEQVYTEDTAYMITDILKGTFGEIGTGRGLDLGGIPVAGKTGTTNSSKDAWFCGYTRHYTTAVWMGYDTPRDMPGVYGATYAGKMWKNIMINLNNGLSVEDWEMPSTVVLDNYDNKGDRISQDTGMQDLFSTTAEVQAEIRRHEREQQQLAKQVLVDVEKFESMQINSVEDTYGIEEKYLEIRKKVAAIELATERNEYSNRVYDKYTELQNTVSEWSDTIAKYEMEKAEAEKESLIAAESEAEVKRQELTKQTTIDEVVKEIKKVEDLKYQQDNWKSLVEDSLAKLETCVEFEEYISLKDRLEKAIERIDTLPDKATWNEMEKARIKAEEESRAIEAASKAAEEEARRKELESIQESINAAETSQAAGPGSDYGPGYSTTKPSPYNPSPDMYN